VRESGYKSGYGKLAVNIAAERVKEALATGAEVLVTTCPFCVLNLPAGAKQIGSSIKVLDISEVLLEVTDPDAAPAVAGGVKTEGKAVGKAVKAEVPAKPAAPEKAKAAAQKA
jgi:hypothetical protein